MMALAELAAWMQAAASHASSELKPEWLFRFLEWGGYPAILAILLLCGLGLPIPEEVTLIGSGYLAHLGVLDWRIASVVCVAGILLGDTIVYALGRRFGNSVLRLPVIRHELTPQRLERFDSLFARYGDRAIFFSRFIMGVRLAAYFVAGRQRMPYWKFLLLDLAGALLSGPTSVAIGYYGGEHIENAFARVRQLNWYVLAGVAVLVVASVLWTRRRIRRAKAQSVASTRSEG